MIAHADLLRKEQLVRLYTRGVYNQLSFHNAVANENIKTQKTASILK